MKQETKIRNALTSLYWEAHTDGRLCETMGEGILVHINSGEWANRRAKVINQALQKLKSAQQNVQRTAATPRKSKSKSKASKASKAAAR